MSDQDLLDIIETLKTLQIQQQQIISRQQELTEQLDHILAVCGSLREKRCIAEIMGNATRGLWVRI